MAVTLPGYACHTVPERETRLLDQALVAGARVTDVAALRTWDRDVVVVGDLETHL
jgi:hypothetical protein